jgi:hypothetical protein
VGFAGLRFDHHFFLVPTDPRSCLFLLVGAEVGGGILFLAHNSFLLDLMIGWMGWYTCIFNLVCNQARKSKLGRSGRSKVIVAPTDMLRHAERFDTKDTQWQKPQTITIKDCKR